MKSDTIMNGDFIVMDGVCFQVEAVSPEDEMLRTCALRPLTVGAALSSLTYNVPNHMLKRLIALGEVVLARDVNAN